MMWRLDNRSGFHETIEAKRQKNGLYKVIYNYYDKDGHYSPDRSRSIKNWSLDRLQKDIEKAKKIGMTVKKVL